MPPGQAAAGALSRYPGLASAAAAAVEAAVRPRPAGAVVAAVVRARPALAVAVVHREAEAVGGPPPVAMAQVPELGVWGLLVGPQPAVRAQPPPAGSLPADGGDSQRDPRYPGRAANSTGSDGVTRKAATTSRCSAPASATCRPAQIGASTRLHASGRTRGARRGTQVGHVHGRRRSSLPADRGSSRRPAPGRTGRSGRAGRGEPVHVLRDEHFCWHTKMPALIDALARSSS